MKQTLHIGDEVKVIKTEEIVTVKSISTYSNGKRIKGFYDEKHRYWSFLLDQLKLIKPNTKKVKKYKYSRKEIVKMIKTKCFFGHNESKAVRWLLATQPQPIKQEDKKEDQKEKTPRDCIVCGKTIYADYDSCINVCNQCANNKQEESKDIEFEEIQEIDLVMTQNMWHGKTINKLIRNQKKLISLTKRNIK